MVDKREKTVSYRQAVWVEHVKGIDLEWCIREAHTKLKTLEDKTIGYSGTLTMSAKQKNVRADSKGGLLLHLVTETPGEAASVEQISHVVGIVHQHVSLPASREHGECVCHRVPNGPAVLQLSEFVTHCAIVAMCAPGDKLA